MKPEEYFELFSDKEVKNDINIMFNLFAMQDKGDVSFCTNLEKNNCWLWLYILLLTGYMPFRRWRMISEYHSELYLPSVSNPDKSMMTYFGREGAKQYLSTRCGIYVIAWSTLFRVTV